MKIEVKLKNKRTIAVESDAIDEIVLELDKRMWRGSPEILAEMLPKDDDATGESRKSKRGKGKADDGGDIPLPPNTPNADGINALLIDDDVEVEE